MSSPRDTKLDAAPSTVYKWMVERIHSILCENDGAWESDTIEKVAQVLYDNRFDIPSPGITVAEGEQPIYTEPQLLARLRELEQQANEDRKACREANELEGMRQSEILKLRSRVKQLEGAVRKATDLGASGHASWNGEGDAYIEPGGYKLLKAALEGNVLYS